MNLDRILVTSDLSPDALRPCAPVADLARRVGARILLLHVVQDLRVTPHGAPLAPALSAPDIEQDIQAARARLDEQREVFGQGLEVELDVVAGNDTVHEIVEYAKRKDVGLIALSTHGRTGFRHLALGSVAEAVLRHSSVPVLVFPRAKD